MVQWFIILLVILLIVFIFEFRRFKHKIVAIVIVLIILFFYFTIPMFLPDETKLTTVQGIETFFRVYSSWLANAFDNARTIVGNLINMDWKGNSTIT